LSEHGDLFVVLVMTVIISRWCCSISSC